MKPNPIKVREKTEELNGGWLFSFDKNEWREINVPYCPESKLSGIEHKDFIPVCYYKKKFTVERGENRVFLHFGAVDYRATLYVNGKYVGEHIGGFTPFAFDITDFLQEENELLLEVHDNERISRAYGKQSYKKESFGCFYTRVTGIWQPVWIEYTPINHIKEFRFYPDIDRCEVDVDLSVSGKGNYRIEVFYEGKKVGEEKGYPWIRPQETGSHYASTELKLANGMEIVAENPFSFSVLPYSTKQIKKAKHHFELPKSDGVYINLDLAMSGIGSNSCGPDLAEEYHTAKTGENRFRIYLSKPITHRD